MRNIIVLSGDDKTAKEQFLRQVRANIGLGHTNTRNQSIFVGQSLTRGGDRVDIATGNSTTMQPADKYIRKTLNRLVKDFTAGKNKLQAQYTLLPGNYYDTPRQEEENGQKTVLLAPGRDGYPSFVHIYDSQSGDWIDMRWAGL